jgi:cell division protein FtsL
MDTENNRIEPQKPKRKKTSLSKILGGEFLTEEAFRKQLPLIFLIVCLILVFITNRYQCTRKLAEIEDLNRQLKNLKCESQIISTELTVHSRQSQVEELLKVRGIELQPSKSPAYEIHK